MCLRENCLANPQVRCAGRGGLGLPNVVTILAAMERAFLRLSESTISFGRSNRVICRIYSPYLIPLRVKVPIATLARPIGSILDRRIG